MINVDVPKIYTSTETRTCYPSLVEHGGGIFANPEFDLTEYLKEYFDRQIQQRSSAIQELQRGLGEDLFRQLDEAQIDFLLSTAGSIVLGEKIDMEDVTKSLHEDDDK